MRDPIIGYAGMTHLGICSAVAAAERGFQVVCFGSETETIAGLRSGKLPISEPDLPEMFRRNASRLHFTAERGEIGRCDVVYVAADVQTDSDGCSDLAAIDELLATVQQQVSGNAVVVVQSQVPPGFTRLRLPSSGQLFYQVETLIFGRAVDRALRPERLIIGCVDPEAELPSAYATFLGRFDCPVLRMQLESAELAKTAINLYLAASVSVTNTLADLCEKIGACWSEIVPSLRLDRRIGEHAYLNPGLGISGGNLERDLVTIRHAAAEAGCEAGVVEAFLANSRYRRDWALRTLHAEVLSRTEKPRIAILGLAYKADTASTKNSPALGLIEALGPFEKRVYDPAVSGVAADYPHTQEAASALDSCDGAHALVIMTPWREFSDLDPGALARSLTGRCVVDPYGVLDRAECVKAGLDYLTLGSLPARATVR
jgi:UDPglucose 6-dehydrogenase